MTASATGAAESLDLQPDGPEARSIALRRASDDGSFEITLAGQSVLSVR